MESEFRFEDDKLLRVTPVGWDTDICHIETVITEKEFIECYRRWILKDFITVGQRMYTPDNIACVVTEICNGDNTFFVKPLKPYGGIEDNLFHFTDIGKKIFVDKRNED